MHSTLRWQDYKIHRKELLEGEAFKLYHVSRDPRERSDVAASDPDALGAMEQRLVEQRRKNAAFLKQSGYETRVEVPTEDMIEQLKALGYLQ